MAPTCTSSIWHATADVWFPVQMDHVAVNEAYRVWHGLPHMDDALQAPLNFQHFDDFKMGPTTETPFKPLERIPGLTVGGWFDAGDFDFEAPAHAGDDPEPRGHVGALQAPARSDAGGPAQPFRRHPSAGRDAGPAAANKHGVLQVAAHYRAYGRLARGMTDSQLHGSRRLGDASTQTDNLLYDPSLKPYQVEGNRSGTPDDRWVFTIRMPANNYAGIGALSAASRALRGYNDTLAGRMPGVGTEGVRRRTTGGDCRASCRSRGHGRPGSERSRPSCSC